MKPYPLRNPPKHAGVYMLLNTRTQQRYIGKSVNLQIRFTEWKGVIITGLGHRNLLLKRAADTIDDWEFYILQDMPGASKEALAAAEAYAIRVALAENADLVLNVILPDTGKAASPGKTNPGTTIIGLDGERISYGTAADFLDCRMNTLQKRLANMRSQGTSRVTLADLQLMTSRFRVTPK